MTGVRQLRRCIVVPSLTTAGNSANSIRYAAARKPNWHTSDGTRRHAARKMEQNVIADVGDAAPYALDPRLHWSSDAPQN